MFLNGKGFRKCLKKYFFRRGLLKQLYVNCNILKIQNWLKLHLLFQNPRDPRGVYFLKFGRIYVCLWISSPGETRNDRHLKFGTQTSPRPYLKTVFSFFEKLTLSADSLEKLYCYSNFTHIS